MNKQANKQTNSHDPSCSFVTRPQGHKLW